MVLNVGVLALQGAVSEHLEAFERAMRDFGKEGSAIPVRRRSDLGAVQALAIPGGESTTISKLLLTYGHFDDIVTRAGGGMPVMGTCAGLVLLAKDGGKQAAQTNTRLLGLMDMAVERNAFGRQRESFEADISIDLPGPDFQRPFPAVFIRAPAITRVWGDCRALASVEGVTVLAGQGNLLAATFHPELTADSRLHRHLLAKI